MLTESQIAKYRHDGYLFPLLALSASELAESNDGLARFEHWLGQPVNQEQADDVVSPERSARCSP